MAKNLHITKYFITFVMLKEITTCQMVRVISYSIVSNVIKSFMLIFVIFLTFINIIFLPIFLDNNFFSIIFAT